MTSNPFSLNNLAPSWVVATEILKGDLPGHEFHGNQYTSVAAHAKELSNRAMSNSPHLSTGGSVEVARSIAESHRFLASKLSGSAKGLHTRAANLHEAYAKEIEGGQHGTSSRRSTGAKASFASQHAEAATPGYVRPHYNGPWGEGDEIYYQGNPPR